jgi:preprotein translocase subunit SecA
VCGMTGTAVGVTEEFRDFYGLEIIVVPPHRPCIRTDEPDRLFTTLSAKQDAIVEQVADMHASGRPVLIGTLDVAESEHLAERLADHGLDCRVLNAKNDAAEAAIVAEAGARGAITVSTQMAGRGTDIRLGGSAGDQDEVVTIGGLHVIGTGRHPSGRLDRQLRGRAGRQGDPGSSVLFTSVQDAQAGYAPELAWCTTDDPDGRVRDAGAQSAMQHAQRVAEGERLEIHRNTWRYHQLLDDQRRIVLEHRDRVLRTDTALEAFTAGCPERVAELSARFATGVLVRAARQVMLWHLDRAWTDHLARADDLHEGIHLRALGRGMNPLDEFNRELIRLFGPLLEDAGQRAEETFRTVSVTDSGADLDAAGLSRPTATWTYLVHDDPFGNDIVRALRGIGRAFRRS